MGVIHKRKGESPFWQWEGVSIERYGAEGASATKQVLIGEADGAPNFALRYFTIPVGQSSNLDEHAHDHGVLIMHGKARVLLGERYEEVSAGDVVYVPGWERHQFQNVGDEPLTFLCIVPAKTAQPDVCAVPARQAEPKTE
ncbi:MAG: hypothetical protein CUN49_09425 [Candidatus Thermofonsia Clade 1 bacterium]|jgi:quercetin dioxygenase-like cupin family protein|uniref:Cupin type-2 domain-containing protein n=1 Tax=Candidatus Thermofonsia Clade 1 bacterium TaxID=2364210 RepID=A0A2M8PDR1_9CHLR|nr:MAG: hypothetical protein CUN49_09425 [Candidatus Thermofonsia Clade 1 bacterium]RMF53488.1 MAG: cupin domain-containing protein [Chloroflexota bacterium]